MPHRRVVFNGRTTTGPSSIGSLQSFAHASPLSAFALLRFVRRAAVPEIQSVEEIEKVRRGGQNRLQFERENTVFSVLRTDDCGADCDAGGVAALPPGPPTRRNAPKIWALAQSICLPL